MLNSWQALSSVVCLSLSSFAVAVDASTLEGKVRGPDGRPMKGADVRLENGTLQAALTKTDVRGQYRFRNVASGSYKVSVSSGNLLQGFIADVKVDGNKRVDLRFSPVNSNNRAKGEHLARTRAPTGTNAGRDGKEAGNTAASLDTVYKSDLKNIPFGSTGVPRNNAVTAVNGGTQGAFNATQIGVKPGSH